MTLCNGGAAGLWPIAKKGSANATLLEYLTGGSDVFVRRRFQKAILMPAITCWNESI
jgi:hypothetical protein